MEQKDKYIRFDWAIKRLLRNKANFGVLEGFLTVLLGEEIHILEILESEGKQQREDDKFNRVDIKARNSKDEIILVEVQNTRELYYLERILYGVAKTITEHIDLGEIYSNVKKVYSISILYFDIGQGSDYLYHGQNTFYLLAFYKEVIKRQFIKLLKSAQAHIGIEILSLEKRLHKASMDGIRVNVTESVFISG